VVGGLCQFWVLVLVSVFNLDGTGACFISNFLLFRIMCVRYLVAIWEKDSISLWILELEICMSWRSLTIVVYIVPFILVVIIMDGSTIHPGWDKSVWGMAYLPSIWLVASTGNLSLQ
jgi:hypothetical protein